MTWDFFFYRRKKKLLTARAQGEEVCLTEVPGALQRRRENIYTRDKPHLVTCPAHKTLRSCHWTEPLSAMAKRDASLSALLTWKHQVSGGELSVKWKNHWHLEYSWDIGRSLLWLLHFYTFVLRFQCNMPNIFQLRKFVFLSLIFIFYSIIFLSFTFFIGSAMILMFPLILDIDWILLLQVWVVKTTGCPGSEQWWFCLRSLSVVLSLGDCGPLSSIDVAGGSSVQGSSTCLKEHKE